MCTRMSPIAFASLSASSFSKVFIAVLLASSVSMAYAQNRNHVRSWAAACANCHGTDGRAKPGMVSLAGMPAEVIIQKMLDFKNDKTPATVMHQLAKGYDEDQIVLIANYFAQQK